MGPGPGPGQKKGEERKGKEMEFLLCKEML